ncbi:MAG: hypothetical protein K2H52_12385 [Lachnospiraceae bacterium]|nr:hypothetical protein [Lachnospiraceae bacterium]MDE6185577.1 hypothetical protein [Lachnospiraceae bacterium]MDE7286458.1 hypothetical protein [Lachnospiraceae bacterium]
MHFEREYLNNKLFSNLPMCFDEIAPENIVLKKGSKEVQTGAFLEENGDCDKPKEK